MASTRDIELIQDIQKTLLKAQDALASARGQEMYLSNLGDFKGLWGTLKKLERISAEIEEVFDKVQEIKEAADDRPRATYYVFHNSLFHAAFMDHKEAEKYIRRRKDPENYYIRTRIKGY